MNRLRREDADGEHHSVHEEPCPYCECPIFHADGDWEMVWEPGRRHAEGCQHPGCICHGSPILGDRHDMHTHDWSSHAALDGWWDRVKAFGRAFVDVWGGD